MPVTSTGTHPVHREEAPAVSVWAASGSAAGCVILEGMASEKSRAGFLTKFVAGFMANWQVIASVVLLGGGVVGLAATYDEYCQVTDLTYAPAEVREDLLRGASATGYRPGILAAQLETESHWQVGAVSDAQAQGIAQFTDAAWAQWGQGGDRRDPHDAIAAQSRYLVGLKERLAKYAANDDELLDLVLAGYNAGPGAIEEYKGIPPYPETQNYVQKIRSLADTKYKQTCTPDRRFKQSQIVRADAPVPSSAAATPNISTQAAGLYRR
mgnify:FL=1